MKIFKIVTVGKASAHIRLQLQCPTDKFLGWFGLVERKQLQKNKKLFVYNLSDQR